MGIVAALVRAFAVNPDRGALSIEIKFKEAGRRIVLLPTPNSLTGLPPRPSH